MTTQTRQPKMSGFARAMMGLQTFLLRRNWLGAFGDEVMVITVTGRRSGRSYSTPIGYLNDGETIVALSQGSQWVRNALAAPEVVLEIKGRKLRAKAERVDDPAERDRIFGLYRAQRRSNFARYFGVPVDADPTSLSRALATRVFLRFLAIHDTDN